MKMRSMLGMFFLAVLMLIGMSDQARAELQLKQLGVNPFYGPEIKSNEQFRQMMSEMKVEMKKGFEKAGAVALFDDFVAQAGRMDIRMIEVNPGEKLQWMIFRKGKTVKVAKDVVWVGKEPFSAFLVQVDKAGVRYVFVVPSTCGNVSLALVGPVPAVAAPDVKPLCQVKITPQNLAVGGEISRDASQSSEPGGALASAQIMVTDSDNNTVMKKVLDKPPFIERLTLSKAGEYTVRVAVTDTKGNVSSAPGCAATKVTVTADKQVAMQPNPGKFVADLGYMYQADPAHYLLMRIGYDYYFTDTFSLLGMVGAAPVLDGEDDTDSFMVDLTANLHRQRMFYGAGVGFWTSSTDDRLDLIVNAGYRFYGEADQFNVAVFVEGRAAFEQFDELSDYARVGAGLRFQF